ncbi:MAG: hypothetical protein MUE69_07605 [Myxococcota bacterium]|nr:hypothetical protein [Myxococcota bacterium]
MFYTLDYDYPMSPDNDYYDIDDGVEIDGVVSWTTGGVVAHAPSAPIVIDMELTGDWPDATPPPMKIGHMLLMSHSMVEALRGIGVSSFDAYPVFLRDRANERCFPYFAVNILVVLDALDRSSSEGVDLDGPMAIFTKIVVDESKAQADLFRLAVSGAIVVSERVKEALEHIPFLRFERASASFVGSASAEHDWLEDTTPGS